MSNRHVEDAALLVKWLILSGVIAAVVLLILSLA